MNVTPFAYDLMPGGPNSFFTQILRDVGVENAAESWQILTYRSGYHGEREQTAHWTDRWKKNWRLTITVADPLSGPLPFESEFYDTRASSADPQWHEAEELSPGCLVIADFNNEEQAHEAKRQILASDEIRSLVQAASGTEPEFEGLDLDGQFYQWQIYLGKFPESFFEAGADYAVAVEEICLRQGGRVSFEERMAAWGTL